MGRWVVGLFNGEGNPDLPQDNLDLERWFRLPKGPVRLGERLRPDPEEQFFPLPRTTSHRPSGDGTTPQAGWTERSGAKTHRNRRATPSQAQTRPSTEVE